MTVTVSVSVTVRAICTAYKLTRENNSNIGNIIMLNNNQQSTNVKVSQNIREDTSASPRHGLAFTVPSMRTFHQSVLRSIPLLCH